MSGDWIKMRNNLWDDPRVSRLCDMTGESEAAVVGGLYWLWASADEHTEDGYMPGLSVTGIDRKTGIKGLGQALVDIGWIEDTEGGITIQRFDEHNGTSAKRRCMEAKRKADGRKVSASDADEVQTESAEIGTSCVAKEEKNIKTKTNAQPTGFAEFWSAYPRKEGKAKAEQAWNKQKPDLATVLAALAIAKNSDQWRKDNGQYIPHPATWINGKRWEDGQEQAQIPSSVSASIDGDIVTLPNGQKMPRAAYELNRRMMA
jgi:hypothetical protein